MDGIVEAESQLLRDLRYCLSPQTFGHPNPKKSHIRTPKFFREEFLKSIQLKYTFNLIAYGHNALSHLVNACLWLQSEYILVSLEKRTPRKFTIAKSWHPERAPLKEEVERRGKVGVAAKALKTAGGVRNDTIVKIYAPKK